MSAVKIKLHNHTGEAIQVFSSVINGHYWGNKAHPQVILPHTRLMILAINDAELHEWSTSITLKQGNEESKIEVQLKREDSNDHCTLISSAGPHTLNLAYECENRCHHINVNISLRSKFEDLQQQVDEALLAEIRK